MYMRRLLQAGLLCGLALHVAAEVPKLGEPVSESSVGGLTVFADGQGLPAGSGSVADGRGLYERQCLSCHGVDGQGGINDQLAGGHVALSEIPVRRTVGSFWPYAPPLFDYVRRAMPFLNPGTLTNDQVYALVAYLLHVNGVVDGDATMDAERLAAIKLPNRSRFFSEFKLPD